MWARSSETQTAMQTAARRFQLMIASRKRDALDQLNVLVRSLGAIDVVERHMTNGHADPLYGATALPDLLLFWLGDAWEIELSELIARPVNQRPPMLIIGDSDSQQSLRMAMKAGAMDYFKTPFDQREMLGALRNVIDQHRAAARQHHGSLTAVINAKGGSGGTFIACNTAHMLREKTGLDVALAGLDIQFGGLGSYLDCNPDYGLIDTLANIGDLDQVALRGFMTKHPSGLHLLDTRPAELLMPHEIDSAQLSALFDVMLSGYDHIVVDLPRQIDDLTAVALERADRIIVVLQQSVAHLRDAQRLLHILHTEMQIPNDSIVPIVNRFDRKSDLDEASIRKTLGVPVALTIPNAFEQVNECINGGQLLHSAFGRAPVTRALMKVAERVSGATVDRSQPMLGKILDRLIPNR